ncbi:hypothetical protein B0T18DRAFT_391645 [Schizothecium vesticola]|uniref:Uncharacterized protein n=1 Tax=Schizothecium vesticola TaxID=314040 RepID=A0AA40K1U2_9PEZI|nr:hypothetical protein B0T18DRAFT_391645 [Schizothecium vesticola]
MTMTFPVVLGLRGTAAYESAKSSSSSLRSGSSCDIDDEDKPPIDGSAESPKGCDGSTASALATPVTIPASAAEWHQTENARDSKQIPQHQLIKRRLVSGWEKPKRVDI